MNVRAGALGCDQSDHDVYSRSISILCVLVLRKWMPGYQQRGVTAERAVEDVEVVVGKQEATERRRDEETAG